MLNQVALAARARLISSYRSRIAWDLTVGSTVFVLNPAHKLRRLALRAELELAVLLGEPIPPSHKVYDSKCHDHRPR